MRYITLAPCLMLRFHLMFLNMLAKSMHWALCVYWKLFAYWVWRKKQRFTRPPLLNSMVECQKIKTTRVFMTRNHPFIHAPLMVLPRYTDFGLPRTTERLMVCLPATGFYLTMNRQDEAKLL
ncbi:MAG: Uncharacterised protein [Formosa sp. Hel3_A1_48]|nr:MAG: Uncharacterised protein [Formosa sp. Hel3_A1_48]